MTKTLNILFGLFISLMCCQAQNLIPDWDANGATGAGSEGNKWGFAASTGGTDWQQANQLGVRYRDVSNVAIEGGGQFTGREFLYRWEGSYIGSTMSLGLPTDPGNSTGQKGILLKANQPYRLTGQYEWIDNANDPTYEFSISDAPQGGNVIKTKTYTTSTKKLYHPLDIYFIVPEDKEYYIQLRQTTGLNGQQGGLIGLAELNLEETEADPTEGVYMADGVKTFTTDGTWCWFQDPRAIYYKGQHEKTYSGWITSDGDIQVASYNHKTGEIKTTTVREDFQIDDHNNPTFLIRKDGRILVAYSGHFFGPMRVIVSDKPEDISSFGPEATFGTSVTYANPYQIGDDIYMFYRDGSTWHPSVAISKDDGLIWSQPQEFITRNGNQQRPYVKYTQDSDGGIHVTFTTGHPRQEPNNKIYYTYFKDSKFYRADGSLIKEYDGTSATALDIDAGEPEVVYDASEGKGWTWDIALDDNEEPVILYAAFPNDFNHHYYYAHWDGTQWNNNHIVNSGRWFPQTPAGANEPEPNYSGGMSVDPTDVSIVYVSKQVDGVFEIFKYHTHDFGKTWESEALTRNTPPNTINVRPVVPRDHKPGSIDVMWMRGWYITYQNYHTSLMYYSPGDALKKYDFGTADSPLAEGFIRVTENSDYNENFGFENSSNLSSASENGTDAEKADFISGTDPTSFVVDRLNGIYEVTVIQGSANKDLSGQIIKANGVTVVDDGNSAAGAYATHTFPVTVEDGQLKLEFSGNNGWTVNSVSITTQNLSIAGISTNVSEAELYVNDEIQLTGSTYPAEAGTEEIIWSSENNDIATVTTDGLVRAISPGTVNITASTPSGNVQTLIAVTVLAVTPFKDKVVFDFGTTSSPLMNEAIRVDETTALDGPYGWIDPSGILTRDRGSSSTTPDLDFVLDSDPKEFQVSLENGTYRITTKHGDNQYAHDQMSLSANGQLMVADFSCAVGEYVINEFDVTVTDEKLVLRIADNGGSDVNWVWNLLTITNTELLSMENFKAPNRFVLYPNPVQDTIHLQGGSGKFDLKIYNINGKSVLTQNNLEANEKTAVDVSGLAKGLYLLTIKHNSGSQVIKFAK